MCGTPLYLATAAAISASRSDCAPKSLMFITSQRCPTMAICSTSTNAAMSVTSFWPNSGFCRKSIVCLQKERGDQRQRAQRKCHGHKLGYAKQAHLGVGGLHQHDATTERQQ